MFYTNRILRHLIFQVNLTNAEQSTEILTCECFFFDILQKKSKVLFYDLISK